MTGGAAFSRGGVLAMVTGGFALFLAALYLIGAGASFGGNADGGEAHAAATGLNGYAGLVQLVEAADYDVDRSRSPQGLETDGLLVLTPPLYSDAEEISKILADRAYLGPTLVILPKWLATPPPDNLPSAVQDKFKRGWVVLAGSEPAQWPNALRAPFTFQHTSTQIPSDAASKPGTSAAPARWRGFDASGRLPAAPTFHAELEAAHTDLITDGAGRLLAFAISPDSSDDDNPAYPVIFLAEPDLANNLGLADAKRAAAAMALVEWSTEDGDIYEVTFDMTLNGFGAAENLLTLAFRPPFLAATLSLLVALLIVGWRAFQRFGPPAAPAGPDIAFGKRQLIANGAGLIVRARRFGLLGRPYAALSARRIAERLGLSRADHEAIDAALARRLPHEEPFTHRAARLEAAQKPADILAAARNLDDLNEKLSQGQ